MRWFVNHRPKATIGRHSLNFAALSSSLREGAGDGCTIHPTARKPQRCGRFSSPLRNAKTVSLYHSSNRPEAATLRAIFIAPTELRGHYIAPFIQSPRKLRNFLPFAERRGRPGRSSGRTGGWRRSGSGGTRRTDFWWRPRRASGGRWAWRR